MEAFHMAPLPSIPSLVHPTAELVKERLQRRTRLFHFLDEAGPQRRLVDSHQSPASGVRLRPLDGLEWS